MVMRPNPSEAGGRAERDETGRRPSTARQMASCARRVVQLLGQHRLHVDAERLTSRVRLPDGRRFVVFRQTSCEGDPPDGDVTLVVWFHLRFMPPGSRLRRWLFERESILNTILYAGMPGFRTKLWLVDPATCDYAGLYSWRGPSDAERYGRYISSVLRPLSVRDSVGFELLDEVRLEDYVAANRAS